MSFWISDVHSVLYFVHEKPTGSGIALEFQICGGKRLNPRFCCEILKTTDVLNEVVWVQKYLSEKTLGTPNAPTRMEDPGALSIAGTPSRSHQNVTRSDFPSTHYISHSGIKLMNKLKSVIVSQSNINRISFKGPL